MTMRSFEPSPPEPSRHQRKAWGALLRVPGVVRRAPLVVLLSVAVMVVTVGAAAAEPAADAGLVARARRLQAKLDGQHAAVERLTEQLNAAQERRDQLQRSLDGLRSRQQTVAAELQAA